MKSSLCDYSDSYVVMPIYNLIDYSDNYSKTTGSLWHYDRDVPFLAQALLLMLLLIIITVLRLNLKQK